MKLSILICTIPSRYASFMRLRTELYSQILPHADDVELIFDSGNRSIGAKRNSLLERASGEYLCFIDDDDWISPNYIDWLILGIGSNSDCCSLKGLYTVNGKQDGIFEHSLKYNEWRNDLLGEVKYERYPNHLNCIRSAIAKQFRFPDKNFGEDYDWSAQVHESGMIKTEFYIPDTIYYYKYVSNKVFAE